MTNIGLSPKMELEFGKRLKLLFWSGPAIILVEVIDNVAGPHAHTYFDSLEKKMATIKEHLFTVVKDHKDESNYSGAPHLCPFGVLFLAYLGLLE